MSWHLVHTGCASLTMRVEKVTGWQRTGFNPKTRKNYTRNETRAAEQAVQRAFKRKHGMRFKSHDGPAAVRITAYRELRKSNPKRRIGSADTMKPDADNISKLILDALNGVAWKDDAQVIDLHVRKAPRRPFGTGSWLRIEIHYYKEEML